MCKNSRGQGAGFAYMACIRAGPAPAVCSGPYKKERPGAGLRHAPTKAPEPPVTPPPGRPGCFNRMGLIFRLILAALGASSKAGPMSLWRNSRNRAALFLSCCFYWPGFCGLKPRPHAPVGKPPAVFYHGFFMGQVSADRRR